MSAGTTKVAALDVAESAADVPTEAGVTRIRRSGGALQAAVAGGQFAPMAVDAGTLYTVVGNQTDFDITGLLGEADGDYRFCGRILGNGSNPAYTARPNNLTTDQKGCWFVGGVGATFDTLIRVGDIVTASENALDIVDGRITTKSGRVRFFSFTALASQGGGAATRQIISTYIWTDAGTFLTPITSIRIHSSVASGIGDTSWFKLQKLGASAA